MKNNNLIFGLLMSALIAGCNSKNKQTNADTDSSMIAKDNTQTVMAGDNTPSAATAGNSDSNVMTTAGEATADTSSAKASMTKPNPSKKGKKGKVSITMATGGKGEMTADKEGFYNNPEVLPAFPGGQKALAKFFDDNIQYPAEASDNGIDGTVNINFAVDENGKVYSPKVVGNKIGYGIEEEALRVFNKMPKWTPGMIKGKNVKTRYTLPVRFELQ